VSLLLFFGVARETVGVCDCGEETFPARLLIKYFFEMAAVENEKISLVHKLFMKWRKKLFELEREIESEWGERRSSLNPLVKRKSFRSLA
jgi:hypothetical protein